MLKNAIRGLILLTCCVLAFAGCGKEMKETLTDRKIPTDDVTEFYYTCENINFNASYQRYRFYKEDGNCLFYHETRERPGEYGPTTEKDITKSGTAELSAEEWNTFLSDMLALARQGHRVSVQRTSTSSLTLPAKEVVTHETKDPDEVIAWFNMMTEQGYEVIIKFDEETGIYTLTAIKP